VQVRVATRHGRLSDASQARISEKVEKLLRFFERLSAIEVVVDLENEEQPSVEIRVSAEHKHDFIAHDQSDNLMGSVDAVVQKLEQQLRKYKEKVQGRHRNQDPKRQ